MSTPYLVASDTDIDNRPVGYFVHHHGHGHAKRCLAIVTELQPRPVTIFCARPELFPALPPNATVIKIPDFHGKQARSTDLHNQPACKALDCAPVGVSAIRGTGGIIAAWMAKEDPALFIVDVSAELALLGRICSVPVVKVRMHGDRNDQAHDAAYSACVGLLAPYASLIEQEDWPNHYRERTFYSGGLIDASKPLLSKKEAREKLKLSQDERIFLAVSGNGGVGVPLAPITLGARAFPDARWIVMGKTARYGHETDFSNVHDLGWVENVSDYISAADVVIATPGDTLTHEIARVGRPLACIPEWCYYDEQACKGKVLEREKLAAFASTWPASFEQWRQLIAKAEAVDIEGQHSLVNICAAKRAAEYLEGLIQSLWLESVPDELGSKDLVGIASKTPLEQDSIATSERLKTVSTDGGGS